MGLFNSAVLDIIIGLTFVYLLLAILCTAANEWLATVTRRRAKMLEKGIKQLLGNQSTSTKANPNAFYTAFYEHPVIRSMMHDQHHPSYISSRTFTSAVIDIMDPKADARDASVAAAVNELPEGNVKRSLVAQIKHERNARGDAHDAIEAWFNDAMDRVTGWYKRRTQAWTIIIALVLTLLANADTVQITRRLWADPVLRSKVVEEAKVRAQKPRPTISVEYEDEKDPTQPTVTKRNEGNELSDQEKVLLGQMLGWQSVAKDGAKEWFERLLGWLLTILALSLGAPFWFDILNKFVNIRYTGKSPDEVAKTPEKRPVRKERT